MRASVSAIFQDFVGYEFSAKDNVWFGRTSSAPQTPRMLEAVELSGAAVVLDSLPGGLDTWLGSSHDADLSRGQWQRIALARMFYRQAPILVLDEPTSALDQRSELEVARALQRIAKDRIVILVSHSALVTELADRIYVLEAGEIVEMGSHSELIAREGLYAELFRVPPENMESVVPLGSGIPRENSARPKESMVDSPSGNMVTMRKPASSGEHREG